MCLKTSLSMTSFFKCLFTGVILHTLWYSGHGFFFMDCSMNGARAFCWCGTDWSLLMHVSQKSFWHLSHSIGSTGIFLHKRHISSSISSISVTRSSLFSLLYSMFLRVFSRSSLLTFINGLVLIVVYLSFFIVFI